MGATKHDDGKPRYDLVPWEAVEGIAVAMTAGAKKYGERNWEKGLSWGRLFAATLRHLVAWIRGQNVDPTDGKHHLDGALASLAMLRATVARNIGTDDRGTGTWQKDESTPL